MKQLILIMLFCPFLFYAQPAPTPEFKGSISGTVMDKELQQPIPYATIILNNAAGELVTGGISAEDGSFSIGNLNAGKYTFIVQFMGYKSHSEEIILSKDLRDINLQQIFLEADVAQLDDVVVTAERSTIEQKVDRKVINIGKDLLTAGPTAMDIMNNLPSINVDQDGNISLRGNTNVRIFVDGKPTTLDAATVLKQIPTSSIKSIELITNPSAKYNPEGMSGIINIVLHKNTNLGFNGSINGGITQGENTRSNVSTNLNYRTEKFNFYTNVGGNTGKFLHNGYIENTETAASQDFDFLNDNTGGLVKLGADYFLNDKNTISFYTNQNFFESAFDGNMDIRYPDNSQPNILQEFYAEEEGFSSNYNIHWNHDFEKQGHNLTMEVDYGLTDMKETTDFDFTTTSPIYEPYRDDIDNKRQMTLANVDYVNPISEKIKLEFGAEARIEETDNSYRSTNANLDDADYTYDRNIYSLYGTFSQSWEKWSYQVGARLENYNVEAIYNGDKIYEDDYLTVYPSAFLTYNPHEKDQYQLSYSRRVDRPGLSQVNPIRQFNTPRLTSVGNPELDPQFTNSVEFNYTRRFTKGSIGTSVFYRHIDNQMTQIILEDEENPEKLILTQTNTDNGTSYGFELNANYKPLQFWDINANFGYYSNQMTGVIAEEVVEVDNNIYTFRMNNSFRATKQLTFQLFGMYRGPVETIQFDIQDMYFINVGARYSFWQDKASLSLNFNDIFKTQYTELTTTRPQPQYGKFENDTRTVYLGFNYRFGGGKSQAVKRKQRDTGNDGNGGGGLF